MLNPWTKSLLVAAAGGALPALITALDPSNPLSHEQTIRYVLLGALTNVLAYIKRSPNDQ